MGTIVVPFRGAAGKQRLAPAPDDARAQLALAMLADVVSASVPVGETLVVTGAEEAIAVAEEVGAAVVADPGRGQGAAVEAGLRAAAGRPIVVLNADLPCAQPRDVLTLLGALPAAGVALVPARDGTTNALALAAPHLFTSVYGPGSAGRFVAHAGRLGVPVSVAEIPNLADDVDTLEDLERLEPRLGPHTSSVLQELRATLAQ
jgi:2-phospho-L-lactate guanylyltransferase